MGLETIIGIGIGNMVYGLTAGSAIAGGTALASLAGTAATILTRPGMPKPLPPPKPEDPMKAAYAEMEAIKKRRGSASTILTGPEGLTGAATTTKTQLGA